MVTVTVPEIKGRNVEEIFTELDREGVIKTKFRTELTNKELVSCPCLTCHNRGRISRSYADQEKIKGGDRKNEKDCLPESLEDILNMTQGANPAFLNSENNFKVMGQNKRCPKCRKRQSR